MLNRHEANWSRLPHLLQLGVHVALGGDWAYFWGDQAEEHDLFWGQMAALATRDPFQATAGLTVEEDRIYQGLLKVIYDALTSAERQSPSADAGWSALATPILERIAADDRTWFAAQAAAFGATYAMPPSKGETVGKVLRFDLETTTAQPTLFWGLERAIEATGRAPERGISFTIPYAIATWVDPGDTSMVELLAINHWREVEATPIRLLYPTDLGPAPEGNESALRVRIPSVLAAQVVQALIAACNAEEQR